MIKEIAPKLKCFTPGIRMENAKDDQKRTMTANEAVKEGSDCLIIGRPITKGESKRKYKKYPFINRLDEVKNLWNL